VSNAPVRRRAIADLLRRQSVRSQDELRKLLMDRGFDATQTTLSRDLKALGVLKGPSGYALPDALRPGANGHASLRMAIREHALEATPAANLVVVKTAPGHAQPVALAVDNALPEGVLGTVAGDDTVFIAASDARAAARLADQFRQWAGLGAA